MIASTAKLTHIEKGIIYIYKLFDCLHVYQSGCMKIVAILFIKHVRNSTNFVQEFVHSLSNTLVLVLKKKARKNILLGDESKVDQRLLFLALQPSSPIWLTAWGWRVGINKHTHKITYKLDINRSTSNNIFYVNCHILRPCALDFAIFQK